MENTNLSCNGSTQSVLADSFEQALNMLGADNSFVFFNLGLTAEDKQMLDNLNVSSSIEERYEGEFDSNFHARYTDYLKKIGNNEMLSSSVTSILEMIVKNAQISSFTFPSIFGHATPGHFSLPLHWHTDTGNNNYKVSIVLKGQGTMFCKLPEDKDKRAEALDTFDKISTIIYNSKDYIDALMNAPNLCAIENGHSIHQTPSYFGAVFIIRESDLSAIHTAPIINDKRIFFSFFW